MLIRRISFKVKLECSPQAGTMDSKHVRCLLTRRDERADFFSLPPETEVIQQLARARRASVDWEAHLHQEKAFGIFTMSSGPPVRKAHTSTDSSWEKGIEALGCKEEFDTMQECSLELNDWRKCSEQVRSFQKCMKEHGGRVAGSVDGRSPKAEA